MTDIVAVCPGSYDPITKGHEDIIRRAANLFGKVCVLVSVNREKKTLFSKEERVRMCKKTFEDDPRITVDAYDGLVVDFCKKAGAAVLVKGVRNQTDYEYEASKPELCHVSSSAVRELISFKADVSDYVSEKIIRDIRKKYCEEV